MYRRKRRRSSFGRRTPPQMGYAVIGVCAAAIIGLFVFFVRQADTLAPAPQQITVDVPDAFKE